MGLTCCHQTCTFDPRINIILTYLAPCRILLGRSRYDSISVLLVNGARRCSSGYFVTAPNLVGHGSRVSTDYHFSSIAKDLRPYLEARNYSLVIGHSVGATTALSLFQHLPSSHPTAILLVDPPMQPTSTKFELLDNKLTDLCINVRSAEAYRTENPLWTREDGIYRELGTRICSVEAIHGIFSVSDRQCCPCGGLELIQVNRFTSNSKISPGIFSIT